MTATGPTPDSFGDRRDAFAVVREYLGMERDHPVYAYGEEFEAADPNQYIPKKERDVAEGRTPDHHSMNAVERQMHGLDR